MTSPRRHKLCTHTSVSLALFMRWKERTSCSWQLEDFREHCLELGREKSRRPILDWLRDFDALTKDDAALFEADGSGLFAPVRH